MTKDERPGYAADSGQAQSAPVLPPGSVTMDFLTGAWSGAIQRGRQRRSETGDDAGQAARSTPQ
jgi:hypothetical protein